MSYNYNRHRIKRLESEHQLKLAQEKLDKEKLEESKSKVKKA